MHGTDVESLLAELTAKQTLMLLTLSAPLRPRPGDPSRVSVRPVTLKNGLCYQIEYRIGSQATHRNVPPEELPARVAEALTGSRFRKGRICCATEDIVLTFKDGAVSARSEPPTKQVAELTHDQRKRHVIPEGVACPFLERLGVMTASGAVIAKRFHKFKQINRFLEVVADVVPWLEPSKEIRIVDFGCGKGYLTFALYHYLSERLGMSVRITGIDLKSDVLDECGRIARELGYDGLEFAVGDVARYETSERVDMVVALHACDTATDDALAKAVRWRARVILSVPCCQHELYSKIRNGDLKAMLRHGIVKERLSALVTDTVRGLYLEAHGYDVQLLEFIDTEHTSKNVLIRARLNGADDPARAEAYRTFKQFWGIEPYIDSLP